MNSAQVLLAWYSQSRLNRQATATSRRAPVIDSCCNAFISSIRFPLINGVASCEANKEYLTDVLVDTLSLWLRCGLDFMIATADDESRSSCVPARPVYSHFEKHDILTAYACINVSVMFQCGLYFDLARNAND